MDVGWPPKKRSRTTHVCGLQVNNNRDLFPEPYSSYLLKKVGVLRLVKCAGGGNGTRLFTILTITGHRCLGKRGRRWWKRCKCFSTMRGFQAPKGRTFGNTLVGKNNGKWYRNNQHISVARRVKMEHPDPHPGRPCLPLPWLFFGGLVRWVLLEPGPTSAY